MISRLNNFRICFPGYKSNLNNEDMKKDETSLEDFVALTLENFVDHVVHVIQVIYEVY